MTWEETHRRWRAMREIAEVADLVGDGELPWNEEYAAIFGTPDELVRGLRYRWDLTARTQLDSHLAEAQLDERRRALTARNAGVLRILRRYDAPAAGTVEEDRRVSA